MGKRWVLTVFSREERLSLQHLGENATCAPDVDLDIVLLPCKHNLGRAVVSCRDISSHLRILNSSKSKIANLQIAVLVHEDVAGFEITMNNTGAMYIFEASL